MSLFDTIAGSISKAAGGTIGNLSKMASGSVGSLTSGATKVLGGFSGSALAGAAINKAIGKFAPAAYNTVRSLQNGDLFGAAVNGIDALRMKAGIKSPLWNPLIADLLYNGRANPLLGGITPAEAARITNEIIATPYAKKNLWYIEIEDWNPPGDDISAVFNLFATDLSFTPNTITSDAKPIGMGNMDNVTGTERVDVRLTTLDDAQGSIRQWFDAKCAQVARIDGTVGLPVDYLVTIRIIQSAVNYEAMAQFGGFKQSFVMRPGSIEIELSRGEDAMQQLQLTFNQFDTFVFETI